MQDETRIAQHFDTSVSAIVIRETALVGHVRSVREMACMSLLPQAVSLIEKELQVSFTSIRSPES